jgi:hypothetical protein
MGAKFCHTKFQQNFEKISLNFLLPTLICTPLQTVITGPKLLFSCGGRVTASAKIPYQRHMQKLSLSRFYYYKISMTHSDCFTRSPLSSVITKN